MIIGYNTLQLLHGDLSIKMRAILMQIVTVQISAAIWISNITNNKNWLHKDMKGEGSKLMLTKNSLQHDYFVTFLYIIH